MISFQGRLIENGVPAAGTKDIRFRIYNTGPGTGGTVLFGPETHAGISLGPGGVFQTMIGANTSGGIPKGVFSGTTAWIEVAISTPGGAFEIQAHRTRMVSVPYAFFSSSASFATNASNATFATNAGTATFATTAGTASFVAGGGAIPIGGILPYAGATAPLGFFLCDGTVRPMADSPALGALLLGTYGGDGTTTFGVPDLRGRFPLGVSGAHPLAQIAGAETHQLTVAEMPSHNHSTLGGGEHGHPIVRASNTNIKIQWGDGGGRTEDQIDAGGVPVGGDIIAGSSGSGHNHGISANGGGEAHDIMPPFQAVNYIIKH